MLEPTPSSGTGGGGAAAYDPKQPYPYPYPTFPPRTTPTFCAVAGDAAEGEHWPRVSTVEESMLRRRRPPTALVGTHPSNPSPTTFSPT